MKRRTRIYAAVFAIGFATIFFWWYTNNSQMAAKEQRIVGQIQAPHGEIIVLYRSNYYFCAHGVAGVAETAPINFPARIASIALPRQFKRITKIEFWNNRIAPEWIEPLEQLPYLERIVVLDADMKEESVQAFANAHPSIQVVCGQDR